MKLKSYLWGMRLITSASLAALALVIFYIDPEKSAPIGALIFFLAYFFSLSGLVNLFLLFLRRKTLGDELAAQNVGLSFRQAVLLAIGGTGILALQNFRVLIWWDALLVVAGVFLLELYFLSKN